MIAGLPGRKRISPWRRRRHLAWRPEGDCPGPERQREHRDTDRKQSLQSRSPPDERTDQPGRAAWARSISTLHRYQTSPHGSRRRASCASRANITTSLGRANAAWTPIVSKTTPSWDATAPRISRRVESMIGPMPPGAAPEVVCCPRYRLRESSGSPETSGSRSKNQCAHNERCSSTNREDVVLADSAQNGSRCRDPARRSLVVVHVLDALPLVRERCPGARIDKVAVPAVLALFLGSWEEEHSFN